MGTDALRMSLVVGNTPGTDLALREDKVKGYKHFANKLWNIARFVLDAYDGSALVLEGENVFAPPDVEEVDWRAFYAMAEDATRDLEEYRIYLAAEKVYHYVWHTFADEVLEKCKAVLKSEDEEARTRVAHNLYAILYGSLKLLHPFMPFITEEIYQSLPRKEADLLMVAPWPVRAQGLPSSASSHAER